MKHPLVGAVSNCAYLVRLQTAPTGERKCLFIFSIHHSKRIDIPMSKFVSVAYPLIHGVLERLACKGLVRQPMRDIGEYSWGLTEKAIESQRVK